MRSLTLKISFLLVTVLLLGLSLVDAPYPNEQLLQHTPTVIALIGLTFVARRHWLSTSSFFCLLVFLWLHVLGARYIYSYVPYDTWTFDLCGASISDWFGWQRNHYDRLVHFAFGILWYVPLLEVSVRYGRMSTCWAATSAISAILAISALYEVFEWLIAVILAPNYAERYNGQQGDYWDAQKDMALAFAGSLVACSLLAIWKSKQKMKAVS